MDGRANGDSELEIALNYLVSQASQTGLKPAGDSGYYQSYTVIRSKNATRWPYYTLKQANNNTDKKDGEEITLRNVVAWIEGSDPVLKSEYVVFSCHADHIGRINGEICPGADDNASGCAALLEIAEAFRNCSEKPLRSIVFLWVTGEEIGLLGSKAYVNNPLFPLEKTIADLNIDMIGRVKEVADSTSDTPVTGPNGVFVISDEQSKDLMLIAEKADKKSIIDFDYSLSGRNSHLNLFARSDHFNFVKSDIPVLFFTTGLHSDYHSTNDITSKIDFNKMELITRCIFEIGLEIANRKQRLHVDNPYSKRE
ncbi:MAG: M20/M25/M40 family metallo-hydrolase [Bacteroidales bacterium]|nr:M20/M25/M40 family metallo-hydrolase [Bacteroidales bacterium]